MMNFPLYSQCIQLLHVIILIINNLIILIIIIYLFNLITAARWKQRGGAYVTDAETSLLSVAADCGRFTYGCACDAGGTAYRK